MIARLEVTRGTLTEYPLAEKVRGGWQNGVTFYPDADVTKVTPLALIACRSQGASSHRARGLRLSSVELLNTSSNEPTRGSFRAARIAPTGSASSSS